MDRKRLSRLQKFLADCGMCSRRKAEEWITEGLVTVNGEIPALGRKIDPERDVVKVRNKRVPLPFLSPLTLMVNKPKGFICSNKDEHAERLIFELIEGKHAKHRLFCAGRLDMDSEGLVILTNDGQLTHRLTHPSRQISKRYQVELNRRLEKEDLERLLSGMEVEGEFLRLDEIKARSGTPTGASKIEVIMGHGKKREIRRAFGALKYRVKKLKRYAIGRLFLDNLPLGSYRILDPKEIDLLLDG